MLMYIFRSEFYSCECSYKTKNPNYRKFQIPEGLSESLEILSSNSFSNQKRIFSRDFAMNLESNENTCEKVCETVASSQTCHLNIEDIVASSNINDSCLIFNSEEPKQNVNALRTPKKSDCNKSNIEPINIAKRRRMQTETEFDSLLSNPAVQCSSLSSSCKQYQSPPSLKTTSVTKCNKCNKQFNTVGGLNIHISKKHKE